MSTKAQKLSLALVLVLGAHACRVDGTCKIGGEGGCPEGTYCEDGEGLKPGNEGICLRVSCGEDGCPPGTYCGGDKMSTCQPLPLPLLKGAQFSNDCTAIELLGESATQASASYASSFGSVDTLCPQGVNTEETGFRCILSTSPTNPFVSGTHVFQWTVEDSLGRKSSSPAYAFQTTLAMFPMELVSPSAELGRDAMAGRQVLASAVGTPHPAGGCWGGDTTALRGSISAGIWHTCALWHDGTVRCWGIATAGGDNYGQAVVPANLDPVVAVAAGRFHTCVLQKAGTVRCWGIMTSGTTDGNNQGQAVVPADLGPVVAIAVGHLHTCALQVNNTVRCWGTNSSGQTNVPANLTSALTIVAGYEHTCALRADSTVRCWGMNDHGQSTTPEDLGPVAAIAAGVWHTCALQTEGTVRCWGINSGIEDFGQTVVPEDLGPAVAIAAGDRYTCALQAEGTVRCWGADTNGQTNVPGNLGPVVAVAAGHGHTCALQSTGAVRCWGWNNYGQAESPLGVAAVQTVGQLLIAP